MLENTKLQGVFIPLINVKMRTTVGILPFLSSINYMLRCVEHEKNLLTFRPGFKARKVGINNVKPQSANHNKSNLLLTSAEMF